MIGANNQFIVDTATLYNLELIIATLCIADQTITCMMCAVLCTAATALPYMSCSTVSYQREDYREPGYEASNSLATFSP